jgi:Lrp/AsnC family transcriptional regulator for asnA, asnC and gidA
MLPHDPKILDNLDLSIIEHLQEDGRKSYTEMARELDVAPNTIRARVTQLLEEEILVVVAGLNAHKIGIDAYAGINIAVDPVHLDEYIQELIAFPEVIWIAERTGTFDIAIDVICKDIDHLHKFIHEQLYSLEGIRETETTIYLKYHKNILPPIRDLISNITG